MRFCSTAESDDDSLGFMSKTFRPWDVDERWLLPPSVDDFVPAGHVAHFIRDTVRSGLDLSGIVSCYEEERGYPPYHPVMMTALLIYAYSQGVYSSRRIARGCEERLDFMAVTALNRPDFRTVSDFRKRHLEALSGLFVQVLKLCAAAGLVKLGHVAIDGTKLKANASKHKAMSYGRMAEAEARLSAEVAGWFAQAATIDAAEDAAHGPARRGDELPAWVSSKQERLSKIRAARAALEAEAQAAAASKTPTDGPDDQSGPGPEAAVPDPAKPEPKAQRNFTDSQSRIMKTKDGFIQGYNAQAGVDAASQVIVAHDLVTSGGDVGQLLPMVDAIEAMAGARPKEVSADAGYCSESNLAGLEERDIRGYIATGRQKHGTASATGNRAKRRSSLVAAMATRLKRGARRSRYRLRKQVVEPVFGQIKQARGFRQLLLRGLANVQAEWAILCAVHNLLKLAAARRPARPAGPIAAPG
jgi:transposase